MSEQRNQADLMQLINDAISLAEDERMQTFRAGEVAETLYRIREAAEEMKRTMDGTVERATKLSSRLANCRNELCLMCESYKRAHEGACDGCFWKEEWRET